MTADSRYRAFISYSHADHARARRLHRALENYRVPRRLVGQSTRKGPVPRRLAPIFRDRDDLSASGDLSASVREALARSDTLIVICSPDAAQSRWVDQEVRAFRELNPEGDVLAAILSGEPDTGRFGRSAGSRMLPAQPAPLRGRGGGTRRGGLPSWRRRLADGAAQTRRRPARPAARRADPARPPAPPKACDRHHRCRHCSVFNDDNADLFRDHGAIRRRAAQSGGGGFDRVHAERPSCQAGTGGASGCAGRRRRKGDRLL